MKTVPETSKDTTKHLKIQIHRAFVLLSKVREVEQIKVSFILSQENSEIISLVI